MKEENYCILKRKPNGEANCRPSVCENCGWNKEINERRTKYLRRHGLQKGKNGLKQLIIIENSETIYEHFKKALPNLADLKALAKNKICCRAFDTKISIACGDAVNGFTSCEECWQRNYARSRR